MKPDYALLLSFEGIALLRRATTYGVAGEGWYKLGEVLPDADDLGGAMAGLRARAGAADAPEVKLVLPVAQVKFLDVARPDDGISVAEAVEAALDGTTPYAIDELVYDFQVEGDQIHIAAVARETLDEAEAFAIDNGFLPLGFVSDVAPEAGFAREPFFGPTRTALTTLTPGSTVQGDDTPIAVLDEPPPGAEPAEHAPARPAEPDAETAPPAAAAPAKTIPPAPKPAPKPVEKPVEPPAAKAEAAPETEDAPKAESAPQTGPDVEATPPAPAPKPKAAPAAAEKAAPEPAPKPATSPKDTLESAAKPATAKADSAGAAQQAASPAAAPAKPAAKPPAPAAPQPPAAKQASPTPKHVPPAPTTAPVPPDGKAAPKTAPKAPAVESSDSATPDFSAMRAQRDLPPPPRPGKGLGAAPVIPPATPRVTPSATPPAGSAPPVGDPPKPRSAAEELAAKAHASFDNRPKAAPEPPEPPAPKNGKDAATAPAVKTGTPGPAPATPAPAKPTPAQIAASMAGPSAALDPGIGFSSRRKSAGPDHAKPGKSASTPVTASVRKLRFGKDKSDTGTATAAASTATAAASRSAMAESERMTVFGARGQQKIGGKPRFLGLMLTVLLVLVMLAVAAWASIFLDEGLAGLFRRTPEKPVAALTLPEDGVDAPDAASAPEPVPDTALALPDSVDAADPEDPANINLAALSEGVPALSRDLVTDQVDGLSVPFEAESLTPEQAEARYAATGIWQRAPARPEEPEQGLMGDVYVASIDPGVSQGDAVAIPSAREAATDLPPPTQIDPYPADAGFTFDENGLIEPTPEGVIHPAGFRLVLGPPPIKPPLRPGVEQATPAALPAPDVGTDTPDPAEGPDTAPAAVPDPAPEAGSDATPGADAAPVVVDPTLEGLRPRPRPGDLEEQNERASLGGISLDELRQKRPQLRPEQAEEKTEAEKDIEASDLAVARSLAPRTRPSNFGTVVARAERTERAEQTAAVAPAATASASAAAPRAVQPRIPSSTSVAKAATQTNAINLRRVNLIGVYGKPSNRRALVRLANGRYEKVKVGDRIDGGRVSAIGDGQLSYVKNGRNLVLQMPRG